VISEHYCGLAGVSQIFTISLLISWLQDFYKIHWIWVGVLRYLVR